MNHQEYEQAIKPQLPMTISDVTVPLIIRNCRIVIMEGQFAISIMNNVVITKTKQELWKQTEFYNWGQQKIKGSKWPSA